MKESSTTCEETSHRSLASVCESWRVERIRVAAPGESDWWKETEEASMGGTTDDTSLISSGVSGESIDESIEKVASSDSSSSTNKKFHNCGLETWEAARAAWTAKPEKKTSESPVSHLSYNMDRKALSKILSKASSLRQYELPRRTPLKNLIESYVLVWNGSDEL